MNKQLQAALASYVRTAVSAAAAMYMAGHTDAKSLGMAALGAVLGPLARAVNPNDSSFGRGAAK
ncbi:MAG: hypothetical protein RLZZ196_79 [Bacteroidota bacterium]|jgi:hypothetical protein